MKEIACRIMQRSSLLRLPLSARRPYVAGRTSSSAGLLIHGASGVVSTERNGRSFVLLGSCSGHVEPSGESQALYCRDGVIVDVGSSDAVVKRYGNEPNTELLDAEGGFVMPGLVQAHGHFYGCFARGMPLLHAPKDFYNVLKSLWWQLDRCLGENGVRLSAQVGLLAAIKAGCTTIVDHHSSPNFVLGSLDVIANACKAAGVRANLCFEVSDRNGEARAQEAIDENARFASRVGEERSPLLSATFGLHASFTLSDSTLERCVRANDNRVGFHIHVAEAPADAALSRGIGVSDGIIGRLSRTGILTPELGARNVLGHGTHLGDEEITAVASNGATIVVNPSSNMNNGVGLPPIPTFRQRGVSWAIGTDGMHYDMLEELRQVYLCMNHRALCPSEAGASPALALFVENAELANRLFPYLTHPLPGVIHEPGSAADLAVFHYSPPTPLTPGNIPWHLQFGRWSCRSTIVGGEVLMAKGQLRTLDEQAVTQEARDTAEGVWDLVKNTPELHPFGAY